MPRIFDNLEEKLLPTLKRSLQGSHRADFCVGYFNLRGWTLIEKEIEQFTGGEGNCCRLLIGMQRLPKEELHKILALGKSPQLMDTGEARRLEKVVAQDFREQLMMGKPTNADELGLKKLKEQLKSKKVMVKLYLRHPLHAKLYLIPQNHTNLPTIGFLGSSNLTFSGLSGQGELNVDILDHDATAKLQRWFDDRWNDNFSYDISVELAQIIDESWARESVIPPYYIYLKMAYHLSQEARDGLSQYQVPPEFKLFDFQEAAVRIAAHHVNRRGGVIIGDVVGLGKTLVGTAIARIIEEDFGISTLIICPKNLVSMWERYRDEYGLRAKVMSISKVLQEISKVPARFRLVIIDESHNLRNREGQRYAAIKEYIEQSASRCILLTATPYNKTYLDLSAQLRLFIPEHQDLGIKPEELMRELGGEREFQRQHSQTSIRTLAAFEKSEFSDDWRQLMSRYMVRRTRSFIQENYAHLDPIDGRKYLLFPDGTRSYFPTRIPKTAKFILGDPDTDQYGKLYSERVIDTLNFLSLPRYGLGNYELTKHPVKPRSDEQKILDGLSRAGRRLMGFCRINLFKRLESSGKAFIESLERHVLRNYVYLYALENQLEIPIGTQDATFLEADHNDEDIDSVVSMTFDVETSEDDSTLEDEVSLINTLAQKEAEYKRQAAQIYDRYKTQYQKRFKWLRSSLFSPKLKEDLLKDAFSLLALLNHCGTWEDHRDQKLQTLIKLLTQDHPDEKILIFTQFADTARYLAQSLQNYGLIQVVKVTGQTSDPSEIAQRFSPKSNQMNIPSEEQIRILIATDVLSEGQNLQDCRIIINYDLPWAIIRLIQRAGRVDRIGQEASEILCYSFLPTEGVEKLINLRGRLTARLQQNAEIVGTDEAFFEDSNGNNQILDLYHEKAGIFDEEEEDNEVDLTSEAFQIWKNATDADPSLAKIIPNLPHVIYSTRQHLDHSSMSDHPLEKDTEYGKISDPEGVLMYLRTSEGTDALAYIDKEGKSVTQSQMRILRIARCQRDTPAINKHPQHHDLVAKGAELVLEQQKTSGGVLGSPRSARSRTYERLKSYIEKTKKQTPLLTQGPDWSILKKAFEEIYHYPLKETAVIKLNRQLKSGITDEQLALIVVSLRENDALCVIHPEDIQQDAQIICSMGLFRETDILSVER